MLIQILLYWRSVGTVPILCYILQRRMFVLKNKQLIKGISKIKEFVYRRGKNFRKSRNLAWCIFDAKILNYSYPFGKGEFEISRLKRVFRD